MHHIFTLLWSVIITMLHRKNAESAGRSVWEGGWSCPHGWLVVFTANTFMKNFCFSAQSHRKHIVPTYICVRNVSAQTSHDIKKSTWGPSKVSCALIFWNSPKNLLQSLPTAMHIFIYIQIYNQKVIRSQNVYSVWCTNIAEIYDIKQKKRERKQKRKLYCIEKVNRE